MDYVSGPYSVKFPAEQTMTPFNIPIIDDDVVETAENFTLLNITTPMPFISVIPSEATVTIADNDSKLQYNTVYSIFGTSIMII